MGLTSSEEPMVQCAKMLRVEGIENTLVLRRPTELILVTGFTQPGLQRSYDIDPPAAERHRQIGIRCIFIKIELERRHAAGDRLQPNSAASRSCSRASSASNCSISSGLAW